MAAAASHVVAAVNFLNEYPAPWTPLVVAEQFLIFDVVSSDIQLWSIIRLLPLYGRLY